jgi:hypothetical protein
MEYSVNISVGHKVFYIIDTYRNFIDTVTVIRDGSTKTRNHYCETIEGYWVGIYTLTNGESFNFDGVETWSIV